MLSSRPKHRLSTDNAILALEAVLFGPEDPEQLDTLQSEENAKKFVDRQIYELGSVE